MKTAAGGLQNEGGQDCLLVTLIDQHEKSNLVKRCGHSHKVTVTV